MPGHRLASRRW
uniref:Uncharacterized protein n=1 Tax=Oryza glumipatula TaxID=40148 RepID=A0A0E0AQX7_9ORYZ